MIILVLRSYSYVITLQVSSPDHLGYVKPSYSETEIGTIERQPKENMAQLLSRIYEQAVAKFEESEVADDNNEEDTIKPAIILLQLYDDLSGELVI